MLKLSIIIPCYNSERFISSTLNMLIDQNLSDCEVIVVNDGSVDKTKNIVEEYVKSNSSIKLINQINKGVSCARNVGLKEASGKFIYFLDSDDTLVPGTLDFFRQILSENESCNIFCFGYQTNYNGKIIKQYVSKKLNNKILSGSLLTKNFFTKKLPINICSSIYERELLLRNNIKFKEGVKIGEDLEFILQVILNTTKLYYNSRISFIYLIRNDSAMQGYKKYQKSNYYIDLFKSLLDLNKSNEDLQMYYNYFLILHYIYNLRMYLISDTVDNNINQLFIDDSDLLKNKIKPYSILLYFVIGFLRKIPIRFILKISHKF